MAKIIYLNGASSAGKTTLAQWLQNEHVRDILHYYSIDCLLEMLPARELEPIRKHAKNENIHWDGFWLAYYKSAVQLVESGLHVILDCPLCDGRTALFEQHIAPLNPLTVLLDCSLSELQKREMARGDRWLGLAAYQAPKVREATKHELRFDTSQQSTEDIGKTILARLMGDA